MTGSKGKRKAVEEPSRNKIILALDQDNFYCACERVRDPSLVGKAVGIKQKGILATCSYEARALGVRKLSTIGEALRTCPDLIIVDGSDLTQYRAYSRRIFSLIRRTLGDDAPVERVGMDEVFCDVTKVVDRQWQAVEGARVGANGDSRWWALDEGGFWYDVSAPPGQLEPSDSGPSKHRPASHASPMILASHLADHLRTLIRCELGFPSSAGVGPSKMLAKLLSEKHKPEGMTTWYTTARSEQDARAEWVADVHAQKVQGFGSKVIQTIRTEIEGGHDSKPAPDAWTHPPEDPTLTLGRIRSSPRIHLDSLSEMFTPAVGKSLFDLLWAQDESEVVMSPDWPLQIGVEDSFWRLGQGKGCRWETWQGETRRLARNLVARLEGELKEDPSDAPPAKRAKTTGWLRFPAKLRTTIMLRGVGRQSKTMAMPVEVFDDAIPSEPRAEKVVDAARAMYKALVAGRKDDDVHIINLTALDLQEHPPSRGVQALFQAHKQPDIDLDVLASLPADVRQEVMRQHGISPDRLPRVEPAPTEVKDVVWEPEEDGDDDAASVSDGLSDLDHDAVVCSVDGCGASVLPFAVEAHRAFHASQR